VVELFILFLFRQVDLFCLI